MAIIGINGKMGSRVYDFYKDKYKVIGIDKKAILPIDYYPSLEKCHNQIDIVIDFSDSSAYKELEYALKNNIKVISGTTSYTDDEISSLAKVNTDCFYHSVNFAKGIDVFKKVIKECNKSYSLIDFIEIHQKTKKDAPSGTARMLAKEIDFDENEIQALRINFSRAIHELIFASSNERITIMHEVINPIAFVEGLDDVVKKMIGE